MKITKILSAAAAAVVAVSAVAVSASADFRAVTDGTQYLLADSTGNYGICLFSDGTNKDGVPAMSIDGLDLAAITHVAFTFSVIDDADNRDWWDGMGGGAIVVSAHSDLTTTDANLYNKYNWASAGNFWGVIDEDLGLETQDAAQGILTEKVGDYTYKIEADVINPIANGDLGNPSLYRIFMQAWSFTMSDIEVIETELSDANGNVLATFDAKGNVTLGAGADVAADDTADDAAEDTAEDVVVDDTASEDVAADDTASEDVAADDTAAEDVADDTAAEDVADDTAADDAAADDTAADDTAAPDKTAPAKGSPETGVEGVAAVAGVAIVAAGAVVLSKKRK